MTFLVLILDAKDLKEQDNFKNNLKLIIKSYNLKILSR